MPDTTYYILSHVKGAEVGVQPTLDGQDIFIQHSDIGQSLACLLGFGKADIVRRGDASTGASSTTGEVDDLLVELIDLLISIRYAHPAMVQLEMILEPDEP